MIQLVKYEPTTDRYYTLASALLHHPHRWADQTKVAAASNARHCSYDRTEQEWVIILDAIEEQLALVCKLSYSDGPTV